MQGKKGEGRGMGQCLQQRKEEGKTVLTEWEEEGEGFHNLQNQKDLGPDYWGGEAGLAFSAVMVPLDGSP